MDLMLPAWQLARLTWLARRGRCALVAVAVAASAAVVVAMQGATTTALDNVHERIARFVGEADARIVHRHEARFDPEILNEVRAWPGVRAAAGRTHGSLTLERADGATGRDGTPRRATLRFRGSDLGTEAAFAQVVYTSGHAPSAPSEIGIDPLAAKVLDAGLSTRLRVVRFGAPMELVVTGIYERPSLGALQRPSGQISRATLAEAADLDDGVALISIALEPGIDTAAWIEANSGRVAAPLQLEPTEAATSGLAAPSRAGNLALAIVTMLAFLCCAIITATAMTTSLAQQQRDLAIVRCVGASRSQLCASQFLAGGVLCTIAGLAGIPIGIAIMCAAAWWYTQELPLGVSLGALGPIVALVGAVGAGLLGALIPAWRASRVAVLRSLSPHAQPWRRWHLWLAVVVAATCLGAQLALLLVPDRDERFWLYIGVGLPLLHAGWFLAAIPVFSLVTRILAPSLERILALPAPLLRVSARAGLWRMGMVSGAFMIGVAIVVATWTSGRAMLDEVTSRVRFGDAFAFKSTGFTGAELARIRALPGALRCAAVGYHPLEIQGEQLLGLDGVSTRHVTCIGFDVDAFLAMNRLEWIAGDPKRAAARLKDGDAILVANEFMEARAIEPGDRIELGRADHHLSFEVVGVVGAAGLDVATQYFGIRSLYMDHALSCVFMDFDAVERHFGSREAFLIQMSLATDGSARTDEALGRAIEAAAPGAIFASARAIREQVIDIGSLLLTICSAIAVGVLALASLSGGAVIAAGVSARAREFGILEATGASRALLARLVAAEAILTGVAAALVGTAFGWQLAWMESRVYHDLIGLQLRPILHGRVAAIAGVAVVFAAVLASLPAIARVLRLAPARLLAAP